MNRVNKNLKIELLRQLQHKHVGVVAIRRKAAASNAEMLEFIRTGVSENPVLLSCVANELGFASWAEFSEAVI